jgi:hypothetical protein
MFRILLPIVLLNLVICSDTLQAAHAQQLDSTSLLHHISHAMAYSKADDHHIITIDHEENSNESWVFLFKVGCTVISSPRLARELPRLYENFRQNITQYPQALSYYKWHVHAPNLKVLRTPILRVIPGTQGVLVWNFDETTLLSPQQQTILVEYSFWKESTWDGARKSSMNNSIIMARTLYSLTTAAELWRYIETSSSSLGFAWPPYGYVAIAPLAQWFSFRPKSNLKPTVLNWKQDEAVESEYKERIIAYLYAKDAFSGNNPYDNTSLFSIVLHDLVLQSTCCHADANIFSYTNWMNTVLTDGTSPKSCTTIEWKMQADGIPIEIRCRTSASPKRHCPITS